ncbi:hypothetical protein BDW66DRAFT_150429 [Aspergillus desertorum]
MDAESPDSGGKEAVIRRAVRATNAVKERFAATNGASQKSREPRKRVLISNEYEKKIDRIDERLGGIEQVLRELKNVGTASQIRANSAPVSRPLSPSTQGYTANSQDVMDQAESKTGFEGNSLMATQSAYASDFLQTALVNMQDNLASSSREFVLPKHNRLTDCDLRELSMPPMDAVIPLLRKALDGSDMALQSLCPFIPLERLAEKYSIEALAMGAAHAIEISKPSFALTLTSTASRLCQELGLHQMPPIENVDTKEKQRRLTLFWSIYCMDRALALRLGRAATIPDYDIDIPVACEGDAAGVYESAQLLWIELSRIQGQVYQRPYSPAALRQDEGARVAEALRLAAEMQDRVMRPFKSLYPNLEDMSPIECLYIKCDEVCRLSVLTLIYRAIPPQAATPGTFVKECIEAARGALQAHKSSPSFTPHLSPLTFFFCHIIEVSSGGDLDRLEEFVESLKPDCSLSTAIFNLHRLCQVLSNVARLYLEAKAQAQTQENQALASVGHEVNTYLSALGLAPSDVGDARWTGSAPGITSLGGMNYPASQNTGSNIPQAHITQLGSWFSGKRYMMGLLEEDLSMFDPLNLT